MVAAYTFLEEFDLIGIVPETNQILLFFAYVDKKS